MDEYEELCTKLANLHTGALSTGPDFRQEWRHCLLFKVLSSKVYPLHALTKSLTKIWSPKHPFQVYSDAHNIYKVRFESVQDLGHVFANTPWKIRRKNLILLECVLPDKILEQYEFDIADFWVQFHGVPTNRLNIVYISDLASQVGKVHAIPPSIVKDWGTFARAKVSVKVSEQLKREAEGKLAHGRTYPCFTDFFFLLLHQFGWK